MTFDNVKVGDKVVTKAGITLTVRYVNLRRDIFDTERGAFNFHGEFLGLEMLGQVVYRPEEVRGYKPITFGDSQGMQMLCSNCDFPKRESLTLDMKHCFNCGCKLDWSEYEQQLKGK